MRVCKYRIVRGPRRLYPKLRWEKIIDRVAGSNPYDMNDTDEFVEWADIQTDEETPIQTVLNLIYPIRCERIIVYECKKIAEHIMDKPCDHHRKASD